ncbi:hypothetical protein RHSIM_Rhsim08G0188200 [Rhododendron simsii]|uniref:Nucleolar protein 58/56 N-terminal domain-containing protein n=1 Tax=Rhododendron simsii TaxID=118357 RepID=A0A834GIK9_RHOSS|nr:hypothetical protein RHSIM_Rhsim08G0188200 [Rhododendron simsii]
MALYLLYEPASGYALFLAHGLDEIGQNTESVRNSVSDLNRFGKVVKFVAFMPFESSLDALNQCNAVSEGDFRAVCVVFKKKKKKGFCVKCYMLRLICMLRLIWFYVESVHVYGLAHSVEET